MVVDVDGSHHPAMTTTTTARTPVHGFVLAPGDGERLWVTGDTISVKASSAATGGTMSIFVVDAAVGEGPPPHTHAYEDEFFYVLDGEFTILIDGTSHAATPGTFAYVPRGAVHRFSCTSEGGGRMLVGFTPGGMDGFLREAGRPAVDDGPAPPVDEAEIARTGPAAERYGLQVAWDAR